MTERQAAIVRLLEIRFEGFPDVHRRVDIPSGFVHGLDAKGRPQRWLSCPDCLANDRVMFGCETCLGRGRIPDLGRDPMAESKVVAYGADGSRHDLAYARDREIERLKQQTRPAATVNEDEDAKARGYAWEEARKRLYANFHLAELERAIEWLHGFLPGLRLHGGIALGYLDVVLPDPLRAPAEPKPVASLPPKGRGVGVEKLNRRDAAIVSAIRGGAPTAHVASWAGLSVSQINKIVSQAA